MSRVDRGFRLVGRVPATPRERSICEDVVELPLDRGDRLDKRMSM